MLSLLPRTMKGPPCWQLLSIVIGFCWTLTLSGCSIAMALHGHPEPNFDTLQVGATREDVEREFGKPVTTKDLGDGKHEDTYRYEMGNTSNPGRAAVYGYAYLTIIGILGEPIYSLIELLQGHDEETKVVYSQDDRVLATSGYQPPPPSPALQAAEEGQRKFVKAPPPSRATGNDSASPQNPEATQKAVDAKFGELAHRLSGNLKGHGVLRIAVLPAQDVTGKENKPFCNYVTEKLTAKLHEEGTATVVERSQLSKVTQELALTHTGGFDEDSATRIGRLLGVDAVVTTLFADLGPPGVEVNAKVVRVETGEIIGVGAIALPRATVERMLP
ncbi:MAG: CsgG/HfaB family protein [Nitrospirota bacterium]